LLISSIALLNNTSVAEGVVKDVFLSFIQSIEKSRLTGSLKGYLLTWVVNRARNTNEGIYRRGAETNRAEPAEKLAESGFDSQVGSTTNDWPGLISSAIFSCESGSPCGCYSPQAFAKALKLRS